MTGFLIQVKSRAESGIVAGYDIPQETLPFFPETQPTTLRPYISLIMDLGVQHRWKGVKEANQREKEKEDKATENTAAMRTGDADTDTVSDLAQTRKRQKTSHSTPYNQQAPHPKPPEPHLPPAGVHHHEGPGHAHYSIFVYGCSSTVYGVVGRYQDIQYTKLLSSTDLLTEHARQDEDSLAAVLRMKPFFNIGADSDHWLVRDGAAGSVAPISDRRPGVLVADRWCRLKGEDGTES